MYVRVVLLGKTYTEVNWNAELYIREEEDNPPKQVNTPWHWLFL